MRSVRGPCRAGIVLGSLFVFAVCLIFQTEVALSGEQDPTNENRNLDSSATGSENLGDSSFEDAYLPVVKVRPTYPSRALERGIEGFATVEFAVTEKGEVEDPVVVESDPPGIFDRAAIQAALKFKYRPRVVEGSPVRVEGVQHKIDFTLEDTTSSSGESHGLDGPDMESEADVEDAYLPVIKVRPTYPARALERGIEGFATVEFAVTEKGEVEDPVVVESDPPGIFDRAAIQAASKFKYRPRVVEGSPVRVEGVQHKIDFELED